MYHTGGKEEVCDYSDTSHSGWTSFSFHFSDCDILASHYIRLYMNSRPFKCLAKQSLSSTAAEELLILFFTFLGGVNIFSTLLLLHDSSPWMLLVFMKGSKCMHQHSKMSHCSLESHFSWLSTTHCSHLKCRFEAISRIESLLSRSHGRLLCNEREAFIWWLTAAHSRPLSSVPTTFFDFSPLPRVFGPHVGMNKSSIRESNRTPCSP